MLTAPWPKAATMTTGSYPPLTTPWHVPESCTWTYDPTHTDSEAIAWLDLKPRAGDTTLSCYPSGMFDGSAWGVFSPASCPRGWTTVDVSIETDKPPEQALTTATCCSSNYIYQNGYCGRKIPYVLAVPITYLTVDSTTTYSVLTGSTTTLMEATIAVHTILAEWQRSDEAAIGVTDDHDVQDDYPSADDVGEKDGLSADEKAGIGVGVGIAVLLIAAICFLIIRRRRGMAKARCGHEMGPMSPATMRRCGSSSRMPGDAIRVGGPAQHYRWRSTGHSDPPPSYGASADTSSLGGGVECRDVGTGGPRNHEAQIIVLREQKEVIQRRIEQLEAGDDSNMQR